MGFALALRGATLALTLALGRLPAACRRAAFGGAAVVSLIMGGVAVEALLAAQPPQGVLVAHAASGTLIGYCVTPLGAWFLLVLELLAAPIAIYSLGYVPHAVPPSRVAFVGAAFNALLAAMELVLAADGVIGFLFAWEVMTLATVALVATEHESATSRRAAYLYLVMSHAGTGCLIAAFLTLGAATGSWAFASMQASGATAGATRDVIFLLFLIGFGIKAGIAPLHVWLPEAHPAAPSSISALMSAALIKTGVFGLLRFCVLGLGTPRAAWGLTLMGLGALSAILGVLYALAQNDIKRLLAFSTIENAGIIVLAIGAGSMALSAGRGELAALGFAAGLLHVLNHAVFKGLLFLGAGGVVAATGTRRIEELGGLARRMPWTALFFLVGSAAIAGLPLLNGFASEWLVFQSLLAGFQLTRGLSRLLFPISGALLALTTGLAAACFVKAFGITFLALPRSDAARDAHESPRSMLLPQALLAVSCLALGLLPGLPLRALQPVLASLPGVLPSPEMLRGALTIAPGPGHFDHLAPVLAGAGLAAALTLVAVVLAQARFCVRSAPTWGCGGVLSSGTEYTATAFAKPLMMVFRAIYRPTREVSAVGDVSPYFPREVRYRAEIEPTFERFVYGPLTRTVVAAAERLKVIQAGSLHAYLAYVLLAAVGWLLWLGGEP